jgi:hypothetical protein
VTGGERGTEGCEANILVCCGKKKKKKKEDKFKLM